MKILSFYFVEIIVIIDLIEMAMKKSIDIRHRNDPNHLSKSFVLPFCQSHGFFSRSKRRRNDEQKTRKPTDDEIEEGETKTNNEANGTTAPKRVPLSLEEMLERSKKEQEATAKVKLVIIIIRRGK